MTPQTNPERALKSWLFLILLALIWGSSFILIKRGLLVFSPGEVGAYRIVSAGLFLLPLSIPRLRRLNRKQVFNLIVVGFVGSFIPAFLFAKAQTQLSSSLTGVLNALTPLFVVIVGALFFNSRITQRNAVGLLIAFVGVNLLILSREGGSVGGLLDINFYAFFVLLATLCYGVNLNLIKHWFVMLKPVEITAISLMMVLPVAALYLFLGTDFSFKLVHEEGAMLAAGYITILGVLGTAIALILFNMLVKIASPVFASTVTYLIPIVAIIWGVWDGEVLLLGHYWGIAAVILGVWVGNRK
ncbi:DMT family transporter [Litoribacter ruber]|uniref:DMT family transporter n=1 Tax=Litoribacter ruber TaxID=702568 RepID=UPI001BD9CEFC|nr:DMT family transporter [Litoribacter ruber]MBT0812182.1 DMT family transporter [Litoribacter ruber]